jgi:hypothetical protein
LGGFVFAADKRPMSVRDEFPRTQGEIGVAGVRGGHAAIDGLWSTPPAGDWGDDLVYPHVRLNGWNTISAENLCTRPWYQGGNYWGPATSVNIYPTRYNQTFWVGPAGRTHN